MSQIQREKDSFSVQMQKEKDLFSVQIANRTSGLNFAAKEIELLKEKISLLESSAFEASNASAQCTLDLEVIQKEGSFNVIIYILFCIFDWLSINKIV